MYIKNDKLYDALKYCGRYVLPALATLITSVFKVWGIGYGAEIAATIMAVDTFLNVVLGISNENYNKNVEDGYDPTYEDEFFSELYDDGEEDEEGTG